MTAIVLRELTAGSSDDDQVKAFNTARRNYEKAGKLHVPSGEDWWMAGKILNSMLRGLRSENRGKTPKLSYDEKQRIIRDVLIARVTKRESGILVTNNLDDFTRIQAFCNVRLRSGKEQFPS